MIDDTPVTRRWNLMQLLLVRRHGATIRELARELDVSEKAIWRDLGFLQKIGFPLDGVAGDRGRKIWRYVGNGKALSLRFTYDEAAALYVARRFLQPLSGTLLGEAADSALRKIRCTLGDDVLELFERFQGAFHIPTSCAGNYAGTAEIIDSLQLAIEESHIVRVVYRSQQADKPSARDLHPYTLVKHKDSVYMLAFDPARGQVRHYKVDRIEAVEDTGSAFERLASFDVNDHLAGAFGIYRGDQNLTVVVKFLAPAARFVTDKPAFHHSQVSTTDRDGSVIARYRLSSTVEIKSWVLSFGGNAVVIEPASLRSEIDLLEERQKAVRPVDTKHSAAPIRPPQRIGWDRQPSRTDKSEVAR
jgi:predicted DNA-binding transcriptional regulator YafY